MHLNTRTLIAFRDRELSPRRMKRVESHLASCARCLSQANQLQYELELFLSLPLTGVAPEAASLDETLDKILAGINKWRSEADRGEAAGLQLEHRVIAQLAEYLGSRAAAEAASCATSSRGDVAGILAVAEPLLSAFLGRKAASALTSELLLRMALERGLLPELLP